MDSNANSLVISQSNKKKIISIMTKTNSAHQKLEYRFNGGIKLNSFNDDNSNHKASKKLTVY